MFTYRQVRLLLLIPVIVYMYELNICYAVFNQNLIYFNVTLWFESNYSHQTTYTQNTNYITQLYMWYVHLELHNAIVHYIWPSCIYLLWTTQEIDEPKVYMNRKGKLIIQAVIDGQKYPIFIITISFAILIFWIYNYFVLTKKCNQFPTKCKHTI